MSSKKAIKQAQKQKFARFKNNFSTNNKNPFGKKKHLKRNNENKIQK
mgnify:CR=1 FL=1|tara:strand:+ start:587 stop:727 length:141 start_codon:yes stop_codon:yes gene_type:complete